MRRALPSLRIFSLRLIPLVLLLGVCAGLIGRRGFISVLAEGEIARAVLRPQPVRDVSPGAETRNDSLGDGFPDGARLDRAQDRENFIRWFTFIAEAQYYLPSPRAPEEVQDCAALIRFAYRNSLVAHSPAWRRSAGLPYDPGFGDIEKFVYPHWPLGRGLFRTRPGPLLVADLEGGVFAEFADSRTLLRYNSFPVSRDINAARAGDLLFFYQPTERQPYHSMLYLGASYFQARGSDWIVYHTGEVNGRRGEIREVRASLLIEHPDPRWRPLKVNPRFLGVYRFELLR